MVVFFKLSVSSLSWLFSVFWSSEVSSSVMGKATQGRTPAVSCFYKHTHTQQYSVPKIPTITSHFYIECCLLGSLWLRVIFSLLLSFSDTKDILMMLSDMDINAIAGTLKLYFRELPEPLLTDRLYPAFMEGIGMMSHLFPSTTRCKQSPPKNIASAHFWDSAEQPQSPFTFIALLYS